MVLTSYVVVGHRINISDDAPHFLPSIQHCFVTSITEFIQFTVRPIRLRGLRTSTLNQKVSELSEEMKVKNTINCSKLNL